MNDYIKGLLLGLGIVLLGSPRVLLWKGNPRRDDPPLRPAPSPAAGAGRAEELSSYLSFWRVSRARGPGRLGSPYLFSLCRYLSGYLRLEDPPAWYLKRLAALAPIPETPSSEEAKKEKDKPGGNREEEEKIEETPSLLPTGAGREKFHDKIVKLSIRWSPGRGSPPEESRIETLSNLFGPAFGPLSRKALKKLLQEMGSPPDYGLTLKAVLDLSDQWLFTRGTKGEFIDTGLPLPFKTFDPKKGVVEKKIPCMEGEITIPFLQKEGYTAFRLDLTHASDIFFIAVMPADMEEARRGWPRLLGGGEIWKVVDALTKNEADWEDLDLSFPKFEMKSVMQADLWVSLPGKKKAFLPLPVRIKNETKVKVDENGIAVHSGMGWSGICSSPVYKKIVFDRPFLFLLYHRRMKTLLLLGEFLGPGK